MKVTTLLSSAAMAGTALALTTAIAASAPAANGAQLYVCRDVQNAGNYRISIKGTYPMLQEDAYGYLKHVNDGPRQGGMEYVLFADDEGSGDNVIMSNFVPGNRHDGSGYIDPTAEGLTYHREFTIPRGNFDEDNFLIDEEDEIYATATFIDGDGGRRTQVSAPITRHFETAGVCDGCCH